MNKGRRCSFDNELDNENNPYNVLAEQQQDDDHDYGDGDVDFVMMISTLGMLSRTETKIGWLS